MATDYYAVLGVSRDASDDEIKQAYRKMARKYHPDIAGPQYQEKFQEINKAYEILSDPEKKRMVDQGIDPEDPQASAGFGGFSQGGYGSFADIFDDLGGMFGGFGGRSRGPQPRVQPGSDVLADLRIPLKVAVFGGVQEVQSRTYITCPTCHGSGSADGSQPVTCSVCKGTGFQQKVTRVLMTQMMTQVECSNCHGFGTVIPHPCTQCGGSGRVADEHVEKVNVPAGVQDGTRMRVAGRGNVGLGGGQPGDLYIDIHVAADKQFVRVGNDLHCWVSVPMVWAALGHEVTLSTFDGPQNVELKPGTQPEEEIRVKGLGAGILNSPGERGDVVAHVQVKVPKKLNSAQREALEAFDKASKSDKPEQFARPDKGRDRGLFDHLKNMFTGE